MAIIDLVRWAPDEGKTIFAWRFPETNLSTYTQLIVAESQEAVLFSKGRMVGKFGPGKHTLNTENLPVLRELFGIPFGGKNPFTAEVWFVNKLQPCNIDWHAGNIPIHDADYNTQLPLAAWGRYGLRVREAEKFLIRIVGTKSEFTQDDLTDQFLGEFSTKTKSTIVRFMNTNRIGFKSISGELDNLSGYLKGEMSAFWDELGFELTQFYIAGIDIDTSTENGRRVAESIAQQSSMSITGHTWQQEQMFDTANNALGSFGNGGLVGGLIAMQMMGGMGGGAVGAGMMQPVHNQPSFGGQQGGPAPMSGGAPQPSAGQAKMVFCSNCSKKFPSTEKFCPHCGDPYNPCPSCSTDNAVGAKRCVSCGAPLSGGAAPLSDTCARCGAPMAPNAKFCGKCGYQR